MDWEELKPKPMQGIQVGENLENLSVAELEERIQALEQEIERVGAERDKKKAHEAAASQLFKS